MFSYIQIIKSRTIKRRIKEQTIHASQFRLQISLLISTSNLRTYGLKALNKRKTSLYDVGYPIKIIYFTLLQCCDAQSLDWR